MRAVAATSSVDVVRRIPLLGFVVVGLLCLASLGRSAVPQTPFLGIPPQDLNYFKASGSVIKCRDGSSTFTSAQLNDDFCDCPDSTDEPGTSACPGGKFYCQNAGHTPVYLFSSRVNDGLCDCCDGSDEYDGQVKCPNTCWEAGKAARDKLKKRIAIYKEGAVSRKQEIDQAKLAFAKDEEELTKLKNEESILKGLVQQLKDRKEQIEKAEEKERLQKEKEEKERKEAEEKAHEGKSEDADNEANQKKIDGEEESSHNSADEKIGVLDDSAEKDLPQEYADTMAEAHSDTATAEGSHIGEEKEVKENEVNSISLKNNEDSQDESGTDHDVNNDLSHDQSSESGHEVSENTEGLSREEVGRLVASRWTGSSEQKTVEVEDSKHDGQEDLEESGDMASDTHDEEDGIGYSSETDDDDTGRYDDVDDEDETDDTYEGDKHYDAGSSYRPESDELDSFDTTIPSSLSWLEKIQQTVRSILQSVNLFQTPVDISDAANVRKQYDETSSKLTKIQSRISSLTKKLKHDFGTEKEFYLLHDNCYETKQDKYTYKICPFKQASQVEGHSSTTLGRWDKFEDSYRTMVFSNGDKCWNGPDRSLKVRLRCGLKNEVADVDEPSRCEYVALFATPALCLESKIKEFEDKLEMMNKEQPQGHDEL
ncbi:Glucosidase 2 subunit beta [Linum perenne]